MRGTGGGVGRNRTNRSVRVNGKWQNDIWQMPEQGGNPPGVRLEKVADVTARLSLVTIIQFPEGRGSSRLWA